MAAVGVAGKESPTSDPVAESHSPTWDPAGVATLNYPPGQAVVAWVSAVVMAWVTAVVMAWVTAPPLDVDVAVVAAVWTDLPAVVWRVAGGGVIPVVEQRLTCGCTSESDRYLVASPQGASPRSRAESAVVEVLLKTLSVQSDRPRHERQVSCQPEIIYILSK